MIQILIIIAIANDNDKKKVFKIIMKSIRNDKPRMLLIHSLNNLPIRIKGIKLKKMNSNGIICVNNNPLIVYTIANTNLVLGSRLCKNSSRFMNLNAFRNSKDIFKYFPHKFL